jgi:hypothetical protein
MEVAKIGSNIKTPMNKNTKRKKSAIREIKLPTTPMVKNFTPEVRE